ncbi:glycosyltransferase family 8 protein [Roseibium denhamense]|uniref:Alpha-N-acetylglucosamine transferase n=1 Tax=Roseibium denhamense TaxID=76305 RepID=A0ABY1PHM9_9HYPH|nr:glycosyltransferase family 8 protein [Roseibium denhamense]MTI04720.1 glycosyltransferase family 8 protein [Roseibium denhamense]SMP33654.1 Alpha-N-acetylglucosamine transferase [Roseibium denhamense]
MSGSPVFDRPAQSRTAYVTLVTNQDYLMGASALLRSLRQTQTTADLVVLATPGVAAGDLPELASAGARIAKCERLATSAQFNERHERGRLHKAAPFTKGGKPVFHTPLDNFVKLRLWQLTEYDKVVFIDADALVLKNCDRLFDYPEFCAAPNVYEGLGDFHRLNSGVFTATPSEATFADMMQRLDEPDVFWRRTDQTFLETYFPDWHGLPVFYNMLQYVWFNLPGLWDWDQIHILHYQYEKPWQTGHDKADRLRPLIELWQACYAGENLADVLRQMPKPPLAGVTGEANASSRG